MYKFYEYIFYRIYKWQKSHFGEAHLPSFTAVLGVSIFQYLTILNLILYLEVIFRIHIIQISDTILTKIIAVIIALALVVINSMIFLGEEKLIKIKKNDEKLLKNKRKLFTIFYWINWGFMLSFFVFALIDAWIFDFYFNKMFYNF